ncbi:hypothetical protein JOD63_002766 [Microbacterium terrae]|uniref:DUF222 domain-containing protein n=1 Tax=Microbacterium terrae TaxID=69369 RepID=A0A0M2GXC0_9MICO|nr:HNH endonuclease signature motif containing protein [Microbacterium terrae]KJL38558.1 hypothetical protein RS81_02832 [Microbacterium terrae]MBP1078798.1 hypothetical protein [Microbacterium terrae]GLJ98199.1 hypothetical protein GCM10017594_13960 [Microbacterium terrae]
MEIEPADDATGDVRAAENAALVHLADSLAALQSMIATLQAQENVILVAARDIADLQSKRLPADFRNREMPLRNTTAELAAALRVSDRVVQARMADAWTMVARFPATHTALAEGRITRTHASVIVDAGAAIVDDDARGRYEHTALDRAQGETPGRLRPIARSLAARAEPTSAAERHRRARGRRGVFVRDVEDGMAEVLAVVPSVIGHGIHDRLTQMAHEVRQASSHDDAATLELFDDDGTPAERDARTMDHLRADILADLALAGGPLAAGDGLDAIRARVQVTLPVLALAGVRDDGAELAGAGPIDAETARRLAGGATSWTRVMTHPVTGAVLAVDGYRPTADLQRALRVRDEHCRFPGCRQPVWRCDIDHSHDAALGGETRVDNLAHVCRRHHVLKHSQQWRVRHLGGGSLEWTTPAGRTYVDVPSPTLRFLPTDVPDGDPPPY